MLNDQTLYRQRRANALASAMLFQHLSYIGADAWPDLF